MAQTKEGISRITVRGFKSICTEQSIEIRPLTILAGANSSGKSSFLQPLLLLKQTLEAPGDPGALLLDGPNVRFTSAEQLLNRIAGKNSSQDFSLRLDLLEGKSLELVFRHQEGKGFEIERMVYAGGNKKIEIVPDMSHEEIIRMLPHLKSLCLHLENPGKLVRWAVYRERCFLAFEIIADGEPRRRIDFVGPHGIFSINNFIRHIQSVIHLPGLRGNPRRTYPAAASGQYFQGTFEPYVASVIAQWQTEKSGRLADLGAALEDMGLSWTVKAKRIDDTQVELRIGRLVHSKRGGAHDLVSIADVGFGVSQSLPVVVALLAARPGQLVYLEQPEIHLHPKAQRRLANILKTAVERGVTTVVETHSALLLKEIQTLVAMKQLSKDDIKLYWFQRGEDGSTTVTPADLDENGAYGNWPEDFDQTELEAEKAYLDAVEANGRLK